MIKLTMFENIHEYLMKLEGINVQPHFEKISYRIGKSIVATYNESTFMFTVKLPLDDQESYSILYPNNVYPVPNKWGNVGWTHVDIDGLQESIIQEIFYCSYREVAIKQKKKKKL